MCTSGASYIPQISTTMHSDAKTKLKVKSEGAFLGLYTLVYITKFQRPML
jgi:hypothetical protein